MFIESKVYLEGIKVDTSSVIVRYGGICDASVRIKNGGKHTQDIKPGTLVHIFIKKSDKWVLIFHGRMVSKAFDKSGVDLNFSSLHTALSSSYIASSGIDKQSEKYLYRVLYGIGDSDALESFYEPGLSDLLVFKNLKESGVSKYVNDLLNTACKINPWYRIQNDLFKLNDSYYILENPNIIDLFKSLAVEEAIKQKAANSPLFISFSYILSRLLSKMRYRRIEIGSLMKIDNTYKSVFYLPDTSHLPASKTVHLKEDSLTSLELSENLNKFTRIVIRPKTVTNLGELKNMSLKYLFSFPDGLEQVSNGYSYPVFSEQEKIEGVNPLIYQMESDELFLSLLRPKTDIVNGDAGTDTPMDFMEDLAKYAFYKGNSDNFVQIASALVPTFDLFTFFPIKLSIGDYSVDVSINSIIISLDAEGRFDTALVIENISDKGTQEHKLWYPDEYKDFQSLYKKFESMEYIEESSYWRYLGVSNMSGTRHKKIDMEKFLNKNETVMKMFGVSMFSEERVSSIKELWNDK